MLLALTMIIGILPMSVFAEASNWNPWDYTVDDVFGEYAGSKTFSASTTFVPGDGELRMMPTQDIGNKYIAFLPSVNQASLKIYVEHVAKGAAPWF